MSGFPKVRSLIFTSISLVEKIAVKSFDSRLYLTDITAGITMTPQWARWRLKSPASWLFIQPFIQTQLKENIKAPPHWPLWREFTGDRWIHRTKGQQRGECLHWMTSSYKLWRHLSNMFAISYRETPLKCFWKKRRQFINRGNRFINPHPRFIRVSV